MGDAGHTPRLAGAQIELVALDQDHPGFKDPQYRARRDEIAAIAAGYTFGDPIPEVPYNATEQEVWRHVWRKLAPLHEAHAAAPYLEGRERFAFDHDFIPSFSQINERLRPLEGFALAPVAGLVRPETFLDQLGADTFLATQYMRHGSQPLYTPEPDVVHEYIGHVPSLAHPQLAELNRAFGAASLRASTRAEYDALIRVYWYTIEFGILHDGEALKVYGAGILSSFGELGRIAEADLRPWDLPTMAVTPFDPTQYQAQLFVAPPFGRLRDDLLAWLDGIGRQRG
jgi:phenylalanine-4-hydroxylase